MEIQQEEHKELQSKLIDQIGTITINIQEEETKSNINQENIDQEPQLVEQNRVYNYIEITPADRFAIFGDIGGTNFRLRVSKINYNPESNKIENFETIKERFFRSTLYVSFAAFFDQILDDCQIPKYQVSRVVLAARGFQNGLFLTNFEKESIQGLRDHFEGQAEINVLNDVEGMGYSLVHIEQLASQNKEMIIQLKHQMTKEREENQDNEVKMLFTMGTGTGMSIILPYPVTQPDGSTKIKHFIRPSEVWSSYSSVDESNPRQSELGKYMFRKMKTKSSIIKLCKGPGILKLYQFMSEKHPDLKTTIERTVKKALKKQQKVQAKATKIKDKTEISVQQCISYAAVNELDQLCKMTIDLLIELLAQTLSRLALTTLPMGGIYLGGGVANFLAKYIEKQQNIFWQYFLNNPVMRESILEKIPVYVLKENPTIDGLQAMIISEQ